MPAMFEKKITPYKSLQQEEIIQKGFLLLPQKNLKKKERLPPKLIHSISIDQDIKIYIEIYFYEYSEWWQTQPNYGRSQSDKKILTVIISPAYIDSGSFFFSPVNITINQEISVYNKNQTF